MAEKTTYVAFRSALGSTHWTIPEDNFWYQMIRDYGDEEREVSIPTEDQTASGTRRDLVDLIQGRYSGK